MALRSQPVIQRIDLGPGDRLFDAGEVIVKQLLSLRAGDVRSAAIDRRHGSLRGHQRAHGSGGVFVFDDGHGWLLSMDRRHSNPGYSTPQSLSGQPVEGVRSDFALRLLRFELLEERGKTGGERRRDSVVLDLETIPNGPEPSGCIAITNRPVLRGRDLARPHQASTGWFPSLDCHDALACFLRPEKESLQ